MVTLIGPATQGIFFFSQVFSPHFLKMSEMCAKLINGSSWFYSLLPTHSAASVQLKTNNLRITNLLKIVPTAFSAQRVVEHYKNMFIFFHISF